MMHIPVLLNEVLDTLKPEPEHWYLDGTFGRGGHTGAILERESQVVALDWDPDAIAAGTEKFATEIEKERLFLLHTNFADFSAALKAHGFEAPLFCGALFDLGMSSNQIDESGRGFSFSREEPLDMRMDPRLGVTAADLVNALPEKHLKTLIWENAQETQASQIAHAIVQQRQREPFRNTKQLAEVIDRAKHHRREGKIHPATKTFQALRIAVNLERENLEQLLTDISEWLLPKAPLAIISFHEGEDRLVKQAFKHWEEQGKGSQMTKKPVMPTEEEIQRNPRSRSARLRTFVYAA